MSVNDAIRDLQNQVDGLRTDIVRVMDEKADLARRLREAEARAEAAEGVVGKAIETRGQVCRTQDGVILIQHYGPVPELWHSVGEPQRLTQVEWDAANDQDLDIVSSGYSTREAALAARQQDHGRVPREPLSPGEISDIPNDAFGTQQPESGGGGA